MQAVRELERPLVTAVDPPADRAAQADDPQEHGRERKAEDQGTVDGQREHEGAVAYFAATSTCWNRALGSRYFLDTMTSMNDGR